MNMAVNGQGAPVNTPAAGDPAASSEAEIDFDSMFTDDGGSPPSDQVVQSQDSGTDTAPDEDAALAEIAGQVPAEPQQTPEQVQQTQTQQPQNDAAPDPKALRAAALQQLEQTLYNLDDDTRRKLVTEPDQVIPKLAASMHLQVMEQITTAIPAIVNNLVSQQIESRLRADRAEREFYSQYPALNKPEYQATVVESLQMVRQLNPHLKGQDLAREGAALAAYRIQQKRRGAQRPQQTQAGQAQQVSRGPAPVRRPQPYTPAQQAGRASVPTQSGDPQENFWQDFDFN